MSSALTSFRWIAAVHRPGHPALQPEDKLPLLVALDEPELGLTLRRLKFWRAWRGACQLALPASLATQSSVFLDHFEARDVVVREHQGGHVRVSTA